MNSPGLEGMPHMNELEIAAYLDRRLAPADRERVESHLAGCPECRDELVETRKLLGKTGRPRTLLILGMTAAAAALALLVGPGILPRPAIHADSLIRDGVSGSIIVAHGPMGEVPTDRIRFVWAREARATSYRLTLARADGTPIWTRSGGDTAVALPDSLRLTAGTRYLWVADALLADGGSRSTGLREFVVAP